MFALGSGIDNSFSLNVFLKPILSGSNEQKGSQKKLLSPVSRNQGVKKGISESGLCRSTMGGNGGCGTNGAWTPTSATISLAACTSSPTNAGVECCGCIITAVDGTNAELRGNECGAVVGVIQVDILKGLLGLECATATC